MPNLINHTEEVKIKITSLTLGFAKAAFTYMKIITRSCILQILNLPRSLLCGKKILQHQNPPGYRKTELFPSPIHCFSVDILLPISFSILLVC